MTDGKTATERLRELLDARNVEWWAEDDPEEPAYCFVTKWFANGCEQTYEEIPAIRSRSLKAYCVTPEQAIAATLGSGECEYCDNGKKGFDGQTVMMSNHGLQVINFCPNCGRKVVEL